MHPGPLCLKCWHQHTSRKRLSYICIISLIGLSLPLAWGLTIGTLWYMYHALRYPRSRMSKFSSFLDIWQPFSFFGYFRAKSVFWIKTSNFLFLPLEMDYFSFLISLWGMPLKLFSSEMFCFILSKIYSMYWVHSTHSWWLFLAECPWWGQSAF